MARIEYLIQNPNEVEYTDLELLNTEIEKYPYFYSLRALKLLALKKGNDANYEKELKVTSAYSSNRKELYNFIHQTENAVQENELTEESETAESNTIENSLDSESVIEYNEIISENNTSEIIEDSPINEVEIIKRDDTLISNDNIDEYPTIKEESSSIDDKNQMDETVTIDTVKEDDTTRKTHISEEVTETNQDEQLTEIVNNSIEDDFQLDENTSNSNVFHSVETLENTGELIIDQPTIESIIEEIKQQDFFSPDVDNSLIDFDLPSVEEKVNLQQSIEHSLEVAKQFIVEKPKLVNQVIDEEIPVYDSNFKEPKIEQVNLINRATINSNNSTIEEVKKSVSSLNPFQIQNIRNEVVGGFNPYQTKPLEVDKLIDSIPQQNDQEELQNESPSKTEILHKEEIKTSIIELEEKNSESSLQNIDIDKKVEITEEKKSKVISKDDAYSFNDWLKLPQYQSENTPEKEVKYQIIDEFLEKNPKITPIKKQEIPESKNQIKEIKQTDFSDLMTETLAQIYIEQKQYEKAIKAYKILSLKYPEKNSLFAKQIKEIEILKNSK